MSDVYIPVGIALLQKAHKPKRWPGDEGEPYYFFSLIAYNHEPICQSEQYTQKHNATEIINKYFHEFELSDETGE
jgi:hypothetical protein